MDMNGEDLFRELVTLCPDGIIGVDREGTITIFNEAAERLTGYRREDVIGRMAITELYHPPELAREIKKRIYSSDNGEPGCLEDFEVEVLNRSGRSIPIRLSATLLTRNGTEVGSVGFFHDLAVRKDMESKLRILSITDGLTGLYNHRHFHRVLEEEMDRVRRYRRPLSLICFDLDHFKACNDRLGHLEGDNILRLVGQIVKDSLRKTDRGFRYGGDEFMLLLPETTLDSAFAAAERIRKRFNARWPHESPSGEDDPRRVTLSIGVAQAGIDEESVYLIKRADMAMYEAKRAGGNRSTEAMSRIGKE